MTQERILVTAGLPYANGHLHIGHMAEFIQTDIWCRFQRLRGNRCVFVHANDTHGTATMIRARQEGRTEVEVLADMAVAHKADIADFQIEQVRFGSTNAESNREQCHAFWAAFREQGLVSERDVEQLFDPEAGMFLADRFVKGTCPRCGEKDQYGDHCENCNATYSPSDLKDPYSSATGAKPELRTAKHLFVEIAKLQPFLTAWVNEGNHLQDEVKNYLNNFFLNEPLRDWDISRPAPYFGFEIPDAPDNYWYVWFDAPIGYVSTTEDWCAEAGEDFDAWWRDADTRIVHVIGKDIIYFHCLFWPAMLKTAGLNLPDRVQIHGMLTVDGAKMSKSRGTFIQARTYLEHLDPAYLRYFYASKLTNTLDDFDLGLEEFVNKINSDLVGKVVNLASRTARFVQATGLSSVYPEDGGLFETAAAEGDAIAEAFEGFAFARATRRIMALADRANEYVEAQAPWALKKDPERAQELQDVCTVALNLFRQLVIYLTPVLPGLSAQVGALLGNPLDDWAGSKAPLLGTPVAKFKHLMQRVDPKKVSAMIDDSREAAPATTPASATGSGADDGAALAAEPIAEMCSFDDFMKIDLRVARITKAAQVDGAKKLLQLTLSLGGDETLNVFAGIKAAYEPADLEGRLVVCVANLAPRKMKFGVSEGMVIAAGPGGEDIHLLAPDSGAVPGQRVR